MAKKLWSVFTDDMRRCYLTSSAIVEIHHIFGGANRKRSEERGFTVPLHPTLHPNGVHFIRTPESEKIDMELKQQAQHYYESHYGSREDFRKEFGKSYL